MGIIFLIFSSSYSHAMLDKISLCECTTQKKKEKKEKRKNVEILLCEIHRI